MGIRQLHAVRITYLGHAGFCVEDDRTVVVMDPWFSNDGAFDAAWFQYPPNRHVAGFVTDRLADASKRRYLYLSHEHADHFDVGFLRSLPDLGCTVIAPCFRRAEFGEKLGELGFADVRQLSHRERVPLEHGFLQLYLDDSELNRDSALLVSMRGKAFFNMNDCKLFDRLDEVRDDAGSIDAFACQFSGATWHPVCYSYDEQRYAAIAKRKVFAKFESVARAIEKLEPKMYLPSAGPPCFLDPELYHRNFEDPTPFPSPEKVEWYLSRRLRRIATEVARIGPGATIEMEDVPRVSQTGSIVDDASRAQVLEAYAAEHRETFRSRDDVSLDAATALLVRLRDAFAGKLEYVSIADQVEVPMYFRLREHAEWAVRVDFPDRTATVVREESQGDFYDLTAPSWQVCRVLDGCLTWEEFALTFRVSIRRNPDVYQPILHAFLLMDAEDLQRWCEMVQTIANGRERISVRSGEHEYSVLRYCPHQGGDLSEGWIESGCIVCPRHHWRFDLARGGACTTNAASIDAVMIETPPGQSTHVA
jgi:UDP-MurNAc hydroxylase